MFELTSPRRTELPPNVHGVDGLEIFDRGDVSIFALNHYATSISPAERAKIVHTITSCDNLIMEGSSDVHRRIPKLKIFAYEKLLIDTFAKKTTPPRAIHPLEEGCNSYDLAHRYGLGRTEMGIYFLFNQYVEPIVMAKDEKSVQAAIDFGVNRVLSLQDNFSSLNPFKIKKSLMNIYRNKRHLPSGINDKLLSQILQATSAYAIVYRGFLSEYEYMGPTIKRLMATLDGRKGIGVGKMHLEAVEKALEGEDFAPPARWEEFIAQLDPVKRNMIVTTRSLMNIDS